MHLFLSPHLDDAVLSCGGTIHQLVAQGQPCTILTIMAGDPPVPLPDTPIVTDLHQRWQVGYAPVAVRRAEDERACAQLGAQVVHWPLPDCVYRTAGGVALYPSEESLWIAPDPADPALVFLQGAALLAATQLYVPLGVGQHVDHRIIRDWGRSFSDQLAVMYYEEYPYINAAREVDQALTAFPPHSLELVRRRLTEADVQAKIAAIACYESQISTFWESLEAMEQETRRVMTADGQPAERFWRSVE
jgi:LmbE family N-acetylglucosaminyl deacetylase